MEWIADPTGRFSKRPYYAAEEIDAECEKIVLQFLSGIHKVPFNPPFSTEDLTVLIESEAESLDQYADLAATEGPMVEGVTEFSPLKKPLVKIDQKLSSGPN